MPQFSPYFVTVPIAIIMFAYLIYVMKTSKVGTANRGDVSVGSFAEFFPDATPLHQFKIRFDKSFVVSALEHDEQGLYQGTRTTIWVEVKNSTNKEVVDVVVELGPLELLHPPRKDHSSALIITEYQRLPFRRIKTFSMTFTGKQKEPVNVLSFNDKSRYIRIEGQGPEFPYDGDNQYKVTLSVLGREGVLGRSIFRIYKDEGGKLQMSEWGESSGLVSMIVKMLRL